MSFAPAPLGVLGGTFDPVHNAHLRIAQLALDVLGAERVLWIPTGAPGYRAAPVAEAEHRVAMLRLALRGEPRYEIDLRELAPGASGYSVDTLASLRAERGPRMPLVLLIGGDQFASLERWHRWRDLFGLAHLAVFARPGSLPRPGAALAAELEARRAAPRGDWRERPAGAIVPVEMPPLDLAATALRESIALGRSVAGSVPDPVLGYISSHGLYRTPA